MENTKPEQTDKQVSEVDRYERLQDAAQKQIENVGKTYDTMAGHIKTMVYVAATLAMLIVGLFGFFFYKSTSEFKQDMRGEIKSTFDSALTTEQKRIDKEIESKFSQENIASMVEAKLETEQKRIDSIIDEKLRQENIANLIEVKVTRKVNTVTDSIIENRINNQIIPQIDSITNQTASLTADIENTKIMGADIRSAMNIAMDIIATKSDDRFAFDRLYEAHLTKTNKYRALISKTINDVIKSSDDDASYYFQKKLNWDAFAFNPATNEYEGFVKLFNECADNEVRALILEEMHNRTNIPLGKLYEFDASAIRFSPSLFILKSACNSVNKYAKLNYNILGKDSYIHWLNNNLMAMYITNASQRIEANSSDGSAYFMRACAYNYFSNFYQAKYDYGASLALMPTNTSALNGYAWMLSTCTEERFRNGKLAVQLATQACKLDGWKNCNYIDTLAAAYAECEDFTNAIKYATQAIDIDSQPYKLNGAKRRLSYYKENFPAREWPTDYK